MEKRLEKRCEPKELQIGNRYSISSFNISSKFVFIVTNIDDHLVEMLYMDGTKGSISIKYGFGVYELPFTSLEKELL